MTTEAQINANRSNAQKSTGPRTPEGKAKVAQNAIKHGLLALQAVIAGEDDEEFDRYRNQMYAELAPVGLVQERLVERLVGLSWRLQRAEWFGTEAFDTLYVQRAMALQVVPEPPCGPDRGDPALGATVVKDFSQTRVLERLMVYERRLEGSFYRVLAELRVLQQSRGQEVGSVPVSVDRGTGIPSAWLSRQALPVVEIHGQDAHATETPCGVTTNLPMEPSCQTKPILQDSCETKPIGPGQSCETKPICAGPDEGQDLCGTGVRSDPTSNGLGETKPISAGANRRPGGYVPIFRRRR
jgi:hypothetical protein